MKSDRRFSFVSGLLYCTALASVSFVTWSFYKPISPLMWAFVYSIVLANAVNIPKRLSPGINFSSAGFLRGTIATLGLVTSAAIWLQVGVGVVNAVVIVLFSFFFGGWLGKRAGLSGRLATLIGVGTSICGASAIAAMAPAIEAKEEEIGLAIAGITLFGLLSMFLYLFLFVHTGVNQLLAQNLNVYAIWVGSGVHETAQVLAAAGALGNDVARSAMLIKSVRIFMIGPIILVATYLFRKSSGNAAGGKTKFVLPTFGIVFVLNSFVSAFLDIYTPQLALAASSWTAAKTLLSGSVLPFLLATAFAGVGSKVRFRSIAKLGVKPFAVAALMAILSGALALVLAAIVSPFVVPYA